MGNKKKENIQVEFKTHDWFDEDKIGEDEFVYKINNSKSFFFEVHNESTEMSDMKSKNDLLKGKGDILFVTRFPIQDISIEGSFGFEQISLRFGDLGHIHLDMEEAKVFLDGFGKVYKGLVEMKDELPKYG